MKAGLMIACLFLVAAPLPAAAYVEPGALVYPMDSEGRLQVAGRDGGAYKVPEVIDGGIRPTIQPSTQCPSPSQPVPEPGTMAMASMGLLALGATLRRRRGR
jgi:uncharacterized protein (TIGR03382 family)